MKLAVVVFVFAVLCYTNAYEEHELCTGDHFKAVHKKCMELTQCDERDIDEFLHREKSSTEVGKCFRACILVECKAMDADGHIDPESHKPYLKLLSPTVEQQVLTHNIYNKCAYAIEPRGNICETAEEYFNCLITCQNCGWDWTKL